MLDTIGFQHDGSCELISSFSKSPWFLLNHKSGGLALQLPERLLLVSWCRSEFESRLLQWDGTTCLFYSFFAIRIAVMTALNRCVEFNEILQLHKTGWLCCSTLDYCFTAEGHLVLNNIKKVSYR